MNIGLAIPISLSSLFKLEYIKSYENVNIFHLNYKLMKVKYLLLATIVLITSITSCSDNEKYDFESNSLRFSSTVAEQSKTNQRAAGSAWDAGDAIGVFMKTGIGLSSIIGRADNQKHITATTSGAEFLPADPIANAIYYPTSGSVDFIAYYPYVDNLANYTYKVDVTNQSIQENIDLLYSNDATSKSSGDQVVLGFNHQLTKVVFNLTGVDSSVDLTDVVVSIDGMPVKGDFELGAVTLTVTGSLATISMKTTVDPSNVSEGYAEGIVIPTVAATRNFSFTFKDNGTTVTYTWNASNEPFDRGKKNIYNVQLGGSQKVSISPSSTIVDWGAGSSENIVIELSRVSETGITLKWNDERQEMDGFGFAEAYWANYLYAHHKRDEVLDLLLGNNGLRCNIVRGSIFPGYAKSSGVYDFETDVNTNIPPSDPYFQLLLGGTLDGDVKEEYSRRGQLWLSKEAKNKYGVEKLIYSVWTPPAFMKSNNSTSKGSLKSASYDEFGTYLAEFCKAYNAAGLDVYALSPANEPEYPADWNSCTWSAKNLGTFISKNLYPALVENNVNTKIYFGENAQWSKANIAIGGSKTFVETVLKNNAEVAGMNTIAAGHGYINPITKGVVPIIAWPAAESAGLKVWLTEVSMSYGSDFTLRDGIDWARTYHMYLSNANTSAIVWWGGAILNGKEESMITLNDDFTTYEIPYRYYTFGNFSRYIKSGSKRIGVNNGSEIPSDLFFTAYKKGDEFVAVAVNTIEKAYTDEFVVEGQSIKSLKCIITDENTNESNKWKEEIIFPDKNGKYSFTTPANSVVTFTGNIK